VYGPTTAATDEEMERFYQDLSQAVKQVPKGDMLLVMGDFNAKVGRREPSAVSSAVGLYGLGETIEASEQLEDFCLEHELALANTMFKQHPRWLYTWTSPDGNTPNQIDYISIAQRWKTSLMNCHTYPGADCDIDRQLLVATLKVRSGKRQRHNSIPPLNLEELKEDKAVQFAAKVTNRFTELEAAQDEVTPEDLWKGTKTVLLEVARETIVSVKSQKKKKWISDATYAAIREKREAKGKDKKQPQVYSHLGCCLNMLLARANSCSKQKSSSCSLASIVSPKPYSPTADVDIKN